MSKAFTWLHLSDLHIGQFGQHLWPKFRKQFHDDLRIMLSNIGPVDLVIFSGDLTQKGEKDEYENLNEELNRLWGVFAEFESNPYLFAVPGNHDLSRPSSQSSVVKALSRWEEDGDVIESILSKSKNEYSDALKTYFDNYTDWFSGLTVPVATTSVHGIIPGDVSSVIEANGFRVGLVGLNSAFLQLGKGDFKGKLFLSPRQIAEITNQDTDEWCRQNDFNLLVTHHPSNWLASKALATFNKDIFAPGRFAAHLFGHMHEAGTETYSSNGGLERHKFQASSLFGLETWGENEENPRIHGYSLHKYEAGVSGGKITTWPRIRMENTPDDWIAPNHKFKLTQGQDCFVTDIQGQSLSQSSINLPIKDTVDLSTEKSLSGGKALANTVYTLNASEHHLAIREAEQRRCANALSSQGCVWIGADWGVGRDGFIWSTLKKLGRENSAVYCIELGTFEDISEFLNNFVNSYNCSFADYCRSLSSEEPAVLVLDEAHANSAKAIEKLAEIAKSYLPDVLIIIIGYGTPTTTALPFMVLGALEETDTRAYLESHKTFLREDLNANFVSQVQRKSEGIITRIDQLIRQLQVVDIEDIEPPELSTGNNYLQENAPPKFLVQAIAELEASSDQMLERAYFLLKILALLPQGETVQALKRVDHTKPITVNHSLILYDRELIIGKNISALIGVDGSSSSSKLMVIPPQVREYVLSRMTESDISKYLGFAADSYFGNSWRTGSGKHSKIVELVKQESSGISGNAHSLILRMLADKKMRTQPAFAAAVLKLCVAYCNELYSSDQYRRIEVVASEMLALIPEQFEEYRLPIEETLASAWRMLGKIEKALKLLDKIIPLEKAQNLKRHMLLTKALCLLKLKKNEAIDVAKEVIKMGTKSGDSLQAQSIIIQMERSEDRSKRMEKLERQARKAGRNILVNNIILGRLDDEEDPTSVELVRSVYANAIKNNDVYNAHRAATKIADYSFLNTKEISEDDLKRLIAAYHYFYAERFKQLFTKTHVVLWKFFESVNQVSNQLILFRHSSFVWRLSGSETLEKDYLQTLEKKKPEISRLKNLDRDVMYFLGRSELQAPSLEQQARS